jgi:hypothetical protein
MGGVTDASDHLLRTLCVLFCACFFWWMAEVVELVAENNSLIAQHWVVNVLGMI